MDGFDFSVAGLVVGIAVGATGVGGGSLMTPILILFYGISPALAVGTDLWEYTVLCREGSPLARFRASIADGMGEFHAAAADVRMRSFLEPDIRVLCNSHAGLGCRRFIHQDVSRHDQRLCFFAGFGETGLAVLVVPSPASKAR